jgi:Protein of unknown function (DUF4236)
MSWRFRKTFKVLPGVKLNLTRHGLSATLGAAPFSVNVGPKGVYTNVSIPGTGLWSRDRLDIPSSQRSEHQQQPIIREGVIPPLALVPSVHTSLPITELRSASTELLNSQSLDDLRKLLKEAYEERNALTQEISKGDRESTIATQRYQSWERGFLFKRLFKNSFAARKDAHDTAKAKLEEFREQLRLTTLPAEIDIEREQAEPYYKMRDDFAALSESQKLWDTLERHAINRVAERSAAYERLTREPVSFSLNSCDLIHWEQKVPHLPNRTGGDMYVYPGFILYRASKQAFALIDSREVTLRSRSVRFIEDQAIPSDTQVVGHAWAKSNKDGTPDRRFRDNYQIPVVLYGSLTFTSPSGLHEEFSVSNPALAERFAKAWTTFQASFVPADRRRPNSDKHSDIGTTFAKESAGARTLALEHGELWEYLLTEELLNSKLAVVQKEYDDFDKTALLSVKRPFSGPDYMDWLGDKLQQFTVVVQQIAKCVEQKLPAAWGKPGEPGDAIEILKVVDEIIDCSGALIKWELEISSAEPPIKLKRLGAALHGSAAGIISEVKRVPDELGRALEGARKGTRNFTINLTFTTPPQIAHFLTELESVQKHPQWLY